MRALVINHSITRRDAKSINDYLNDISKFDVLSPKEELELFKQLKAGDPDALTRIVNHNLRFVVSVAKQYHHKELSLGDLISEGNIGLVKAAERFDETKGFKFISYAVWWIRQSILKAINEKSRKIRLPVNMQSSITDIAKTSEAFYQTHEREPSMEELIDLTGISEKNIRRAYESRSYCTSLDAPVASESDTSFGDLMADDSLQAPDFNLAVLESSEIKVQELLSDLTPREAQILSMYFGIGDQEAMTLQDIGEAIGITRERVRQMKASALTKLRKKMRVQA